MDELHVTPPYIRNKTYMCNFSPTLTGGEKHQVARLEFPFLYLLPYLRLIFGRTGKREVDRLECMYRQRRAVHPRTGRAPVFIRCTHVRLRGADDLVHLLGAKLCFLGSAARRY